MQLKHLANKNWIVFIETTCKHNLYLSPLAWDINFLFLFWFIKNLKLIKDMLKSKIETDNRNVIYYFLNCRVKWPWDGEIIGPCQPWDKENLMNPNGSIRKTHCRTFKLSKKTFHSLKNHFSRKPRYLD